MGAFRNSFDDYRNNHGHYSCDKNFVDCIHLCQLEVSSAVRDDAPFKKVVLSIQISHDVGTVHDDLNSVRCANHRDCVQWWTGIGAHAKVGYNWTDFVVPNPLGLVM